MDAKELGQQPAHPDRRLIQDRDDSYSLESEGGLTKRELFAAMAMQGRIQRGGFADHAELAERAVADADALIAALDQQP